MKATTDYQITAKIYESANSLVYRAVLKQNNQPIILKILKEDYPTPSELTRYKQEYEITRSLQQDGVIKAYDLQRHQNSLVMFLEDFGGESLRFWMAERQFTLKEFLTIAIKITESLGAIHSSNIIHKDINPSNLVYNPKTGQLKIIDFGISSVLSRENQTVRNPERLEGTLAYIAPEQTGRMNRVIDYRSDFYSLGVTFYELLTHQLPFATTDPMELVHCHIARMPEALENREEIPKAVSDIVMKLMAKTAEERYQTARGLKADLENCWYQLQTNSQISNFSLGSQDIADHFQIPQKLYGREAEVAQLLDTFARVSQGTTEMMLIAGYSGIGKSALVNEVHKPIVQQRGYFIAGKFDQFKRDIPYASLIQAFQELMRQLLTESEAQLQIWKQKLLEALGNNGQVIIDVIPEVELIIGKQSSVPQLGATESQNRFNLVLQKFINVFTQKEHPLVIFLDDLQWADAASLKLIELLITDSDASGGILFNHAPQTCSDHRQYLLILGAYRDNEVSPTHPLILTLEQIQEVDVKVNKITLKPLAINHINQLVADTLNCSIAESQPLAELLLNKTNGNPFFLLQLFQSLEQENLLSFDASTSRWQWDLEQIQALGITDNVVELMVSKIEKLDEETQNVLKLAACIGNRFGLEVLAVVNGKSLSATATELWSALQVGLVVPLSDTYKNPILWQEEVYSDGSIPILQNVVRASCPQPSPSSRVACTTNDEFTKMGCSIFDDSEESSSFVPNYSSSIPYKFLHDRVQQAAYALIPEDQKKEIHLKVGQLLLKNTKEDELEEKIFDLVNQLNIGTELIAEQTKRNELTKLNLIAAQKAKASTAYKAALKYLEAGLELLASDSWQEQYNSTLELFVATVEAQYLNTQFEQAETFAAVVLEQAKNLLDRIPVYELKLQSYIAQQRYQEAIDIALQVLEQLGVLLPQEPSKQRIQAEQKAIKLLLRDKQIEDLANLPAMTDPYKLAAVRILLSICSSTHVINPPLFNLVIITITNLCIKFGNSNLAPGVYALYGLYLCGFRGELKDGYGFGQLSLTLLDKFDSQKMAAMVLHIYISQIKLWQDNAKTIKNYAVNGFQIGIENGDYQYGCYAAMTYCSYLLTFNLLQPEENLKKVEQESRRYIEFATIAKQEHANFFIKISRQASLNLLGQARDKEKLTGEALDEDQSLSIFISIKNYILLSWFYIVKSMLFYIFKNYSQTINAAELGKKYILPFNVNSMIGPPQNFYYSLGLLAFYPKLDKTEQKEFLKKVSSNQKIMKNWAYHAPMNYQHKYELIEAERARVLGRNARAMEYYDRAIRGARENGYIQEEAIAYERAGEFYLSLGREEIGQFYLKNAHHCYTRWGAKAKVKDLESEYPEFLLGATNKKGVKSSATTSSTDGIDGEALDLTTVIKASQALAGEILLANLLQKLMKIVIENAGAQTGFLLLPAQTKPQQKVNWVIEAVGKVDTDKEASAGPQESEVSISRSIPSNSVEPSTQIPLLSTAIINYVAHTQENVVLNDATNEGQFTRDPYIVATKPKSLLCTPLLHQGKLSGILYLENNLTTGAFTPERVETLTILSAQAAISIENARLYEQLEDYSHTLEIKVDERTQELQEKNTTLAATLKKLKATQDQIIAQEKLASLGALTAGVAHEIKNPLNFVNNFAELSAELTEELLEEIDSQKDRLDPETIEYLEEILQDLGQNVQKINHHGKRADNIVKGMLMHSRATSGERTLTDINVLLAEYLTLAYHGMRAKDSEFSIAIETEYDDSLDQINVIPQDLSRVFLNVANNACYAAYEKKKAVGKGFIPTMKVSTKNLGNQLEIRIRDNGNGIPSEVLDKIFNPFFTTKPTGEGTGLGLSISHDIIVQGHQGQLEVETEEGNYTEFIITLPKAV